MPMHLEHPRPTGARQTGTLQSLRDPYGPADWLECGGPLDAPEVIPAGSVYSAEWLTVPGLFTGLTNYARPGAWS